MSMMCGPGGMIELGEVVAVDDPDALNRVRVRFLSRGPEPEGDATDATVWAVVAVPFAGDAMGAFLIPDVGARVVLGFVNNDPRYPVVLGSIWDGSTASPETLPGNAVDRWSLTGKAGTRIAIVEENDQPVVTIETPGGNSVVIDDSAGSITLTQGGNTVTLDGNGIKLDSHTVEISAAKFTLTSSQTNVTTPMATFSGVVSNQLVQTNSVVSASYTPAAGNML